VTFTHRSVKNRRVAIVAAGVVSPLGIGLPETVKSLRAGTDCVAPVTSFSVEHCRCKTAGQIDDVSLFAASDVSGRRRRRLHRASHMVIAAMREAFHQDAGFRAQSTIFGTTSGGMSFGQDYYRALFRKTPLRRAPEWIANYPPQKPVLDGIEALGFSSPCQVIANACASGTNAIGHGFECIRSGRYTAVLTGGYDALSELVFVGFDSLQASTPGLCRPFDRERNGMVLGEGAAVLALEEFDCARERGANILAEIVGYGISTDNHHLTQPDPSGIGPRRAMEEALASARIQADEVDYINAHGTATSFNDAAEGAAIAQLYGNRVPVSSTKSMMGHSLGAAGAIEAVISILAMQNDLLPPNIHFHQGDETIALDIVANTARTKTVETTLSNSFGFGGTNASIVMQRKARA
jgi:3-oxoacyl-[acyl-carrier-protein] synthase II